MAPSTHLALAGWTLLLLIVSQKSVSAQGNCSSPLGMENGDIARSQITCEPSGSCDYARLKRSGSGWISYRQTILAYNRVDLLRVKRVTRVAIQSASLSYYTTSFRVYYSKDGSVWDVYKPTSNSSFLGQVFPGNTDSSEIVEQYFNPPIEARFIAMNPVTWSRYPSMRYELYGCDVDQPPRKFAFNVTQDIEDDQVFVNSLSPYSIDRPIFVRPGASLTIQAGVRILFTNTNAKLVVYGRLASEGFGSVRVVFSHTSIPLGDLIAHWGGIEVNSGANVTLRNTDVWQAQTGVQGPAESMVMTDSGVYVSRLGLHLTSGRADSSGPGFTAGTVYGCYEGIKLFTATQPSYYTFQSYVISHNQRDGILVSGHECGLIIKTSRITANGRNGIYSNYRMIYFEMNEDYVGYNYDYGVIVNSVQGEAKVQRCVFESNTRNGLRLATTTASISVQNNTILSNGQSGLYINSRNLTLTGNTVIGNRNDYAIFLVNYASNGDGFVVSDNSLDDNHGGIYILSASAVTFTRNVITRTQTRYPVYSDAAKILFLYNEIVNSSSSVALYLNKLPENQLTHNIFMNPESDFDIDTSVPFSEDYIIAAFYNYWGSPDATYVKSRVNDAYSNIDHALIVVYPFYLTSELTELYTGPNPTMFTMDDSTIGGSLSEDVVLHRNTSFVVMRSVYVPEGLSLVIEAGVELQFWENRGIYVRGNLAILGEEQSRVILTGHKDVFWGGIRFVETSDISVSNTEGNCLKRKHCTLKKSLNQCSVNSQCMIHCSVYYTTVDRVRTTSFTLTNTPNVTLSSVWVTGGSTGISVTLGSDSKLDFRDVHISNTETCIYLRVDYEPSVTLGVDQSRFSDYINYGIRIVSPSRQEKRSVKFSLTRSVFSGERGRVLHIDQDYFHLMTMLIEDSLFEVRSGRGLYVDSRYCNFTVKNNVFRSLQQPVYMNIYGGCNNLNIENNTLEDTWSGRDIYVSLSGGYENCSMDVLNNLFHRTPDNDRTSQTGGVQIYSGAQSGPGRANIVGNRFVRLNSLPLDLIVNRGTYSVTVSQNVITDCNRALSVNVQERSALVEIQKNTITRNAGTDIVRLTSTASLARPIEFKQNILQNNTHAVVSIGQPNILLHYNIFDNLDADYDIKLTQSGAGVEVNASLNYWGQVDPREIIRKLYDQNADATLPLITFEPYFENSSLSTVYEEEVEFLTADGRIGGEVNGNVTLSLEGSPYTAVGMITIKQGNALFVEAGVEIYFLENIGINVEGTLIVGGNSTHGVSFMPQTPGQKWRGLESAIAQSSATNRSDLIRLVSGRAVNEGRVEINHNGQFGTICDDGFGETDAVVLCRMLGFDPESGASVQKFGQGQGPIWLDDVNCNGDELDISQCRHQSWGTHNCGHYEDVGIICHGRKLPEFDPDQRISELNHLLVNDTTSGIITRGYPPHMDTVSVTHSSGDGFAFIRPYTEEMDQVSVRNLTAHYNAKSGIHVEFGTWVVHPYLNITSCSVVNNTEYGFRVQNNGNLEVNDCIIAGATNGISLERTLAGSVIFRSCEMRQNSEQTLRILSNYETGGNFTFVLADSSIYRQKYLSWGAWYNSLISIRVSQRLYDAKWHIINNRFYDLSSSRVTIDINSLNFDGNSNIINLSNNRFANISSKPIHIESRPGTSINITNNSLENITAPSGLPIIEIHYNDASSKGVNITGNRFFANTGSSIVYLSSRVSKREYQNTYVTANVFLNNTASDILRSDVVGFQAHRNFFTNPAASCEIKAPDFVDLAPIDAKHSFWGYREPDKILDRLCAFEKDMRLSRVDFIPYLLSADVDDEVVVDGDSFYLESLVGGVVTGTVLLEAVSTPLVISRSIYIEAGAMVTVQSGSVLQFRENRGIFVKGNTEIGSDTGKRTTLGPYNVDSWEGITFGTLEFKKSKRQIVNSTSAKSTSLIKNTDINKPKVGLKLYRTEIAMFNNVISGSHYHGISLFVPNAAFDFNGTTVENSGEHGLSSSSSDSVTIRNLTVSGSSGNGISFPQAQGEITIRHVTINYNVGTGIYVEFTDYNLDQFVTVSHSQFISHQGLALDVSGRVDRSDVGISIFNNEFVNNTGGALRIYWWRYSWRYGFNRTFNITNNLFSNSGPSSLSIQSFAKVNVSNNRFENSRVSDQCAFSIDSSQWTIQETPKTVHFGTNRFENGEGRCAVEFTSNDNDGIQGSFVFNQILSFQSREATVIVDSPHFNLTDNILDNPRAIYEIKVAKAGTGVVNAVRNWWGSANLQIAKSRVYDRTQDPSLLLLDIEPIRTELKFDCTQVNNCSGKGECVRPNGCLCDRGWAGAMCTEYDCSGVSQCSGRGQCVGPNTCRCNQGYKGSSCSLATCSNVSDCSGRGYCIAPDICQCFVEYSGSTCSDCAADRWGDECLLCPFCVQPQGSCNKRDGTCTCESNWDGDLCQRCAHTFYGPRCEPLVTVLNVFPDGGPDTGDTQVNIRGHNFPETVNNTYYCRFGSAVVQGVRRSREHIVCVTPQLSQSTYTVEISADGVTGFTKNGVLFNVYAKCPPNACGNNFDPPHGFCAFGGCVCELPWSGEYCSTELKAPRIADIEAALTVNEGDSFQLDLELIEGSLPVAWFIRNQPPGMVMDVRTAQLTWGTAVGSDVPYQVVIGATNVVGTATKHLEIRVSLSYNVTIEATYPSGILHTPSPVRITGRVNFWLNDRPRFALVDIWIRRGDRTTRLSTYSDPNAGNYFEATYYHQAKDSGEFSVSGNHPSDPVFRPQTGWTVQGLSCSPSTISLTDYLDEENVTFSAVSRLVNTGVHTVQNIQTEILGVGSSLKAVTISPSGGSADASYFTTALPQGGEIPFDVTLTASGPLQGTIALIFTSELGTSTSCTVDIVLRIRKPHFTITPGSLRDNLLIGSQKTYQFDLTNDGEAEATNVRVDLPADPRFSVVSFTKPGNDSSPNNPSSNSALHLGKGESAVLGLSLTSPKSDDLGEIRGQFAINSDQISAAISYHINLVSDTRLNLTVQVEDEFTYFDESHPLVSGAKVTLSNSRRNYRTTLTTTNSTGWVIFGDIHEDKYDLRVEAPGHGSYAAVIVAESSSPTMSVFLQRTAVTYTFSVTPTTFEDKYVITLETTFEAQVPMPVVTIEPAQIDTIPYEDGRETVIAFRLTNHGLIRADNVRFRLPDHPQLIFDMTAIEVGHLEANSSVIVPVNVERRNAVIPTTTPSPTTASRRTLPPRGSTVSPVTRSPPTKSPSTKSPSTRPPSPDPPGGSNNGDGSDGPSGSSSSSSCAIVVYYDYVCGVVQTRRIVVTLSRFHPGRPPMPCVVSVSVTRPSSTGTSTGTRRIGGGGGGSGFSGSGGLIVYKPITPISCDCLKSYVKNCIPFGSCAVSTLEGSLAGIAKDCILPILPISGCAKSAIGATFSKTFLDIIISIIDIAISCVVSTICPICGPIWTLIKCLTNVIFTCGFGGFGRRRREVSSAIVENLVQKSQPMDNFLELSVGIFGSRDMLELPDNSWYDRFKSAVGDDSPSGNFLTSTEYNYIWAGMNDTTARESIRYFLNRWNNTVAAIQEGTLGSRGEDDNVIPYESTQEKYDQYIADSAKAKEAGFNTVFDEFDNAVGIYIDAKKQESGRSEEGVCAKVRVRIVQDLVLTRDAFNARLEIENGEQSALTNIKVVLKITPSLDFSINASDKFAIGEATLVGLTGVGGQGSLERAISGSADWLIIPYSTAAIRQDTQYDVGGSLSYSVGSSSLTVSLLPDTITVKPNPNLIVHYFHQKYVIGDDPFTDPVEPSIPFILAVMITNTGYGVAKSVRLTSAEPEIIENEKGLLVNFKITGTALDGEPIPYSLTVDFGDIEPFETTVARWYLTTSLKGLFYNYTATFENINPLGDPQLSVLDVLRSHELIHTVRQDFPNDDNLDDFLVNDDLDATDMADHVFDSSTGLKSQLVESVVTQFEPIPETRQEGQYTAVNITCNVTSAGWLYVRVETDLASPDSGERQLLSVTRSDGKEIQLVHNTWTTDYYRDTSYFHLFDYSEENSTDVNYMALFGPGNKYNPAFDKAEYGLEVAFPLSADTYLITVHASDQDGSLVRYSLGSHTHQFVIDSETGEIKSRVAATDPRTVDVTVIATDSGVPQKSASVTLTISPINRSTKPLLTPKGTTKATTRMTSTSRNPLTTREEPSSSRKVSLSTKKSSVPTTTLYPFFTTTDANDTNTTGRVCNHTDMNCTISGAFHWATTSSSTFAPLFILLITAIYVAN